MVHRVTVYPGQIPLDTDVLNTARFGMVGLGESLKATLGTGTTCDGLAVTATTPASLAVLVAPGAIYSLQNVDGSAYGSLAADTTHQTVKQGLLADAVTLATPAPGTAGQSVIYLIQAVYSDQDTDPVVLPYYNAANPSQAYSGPNNSGTSQNTLRKGVCVVSAKAGVSAVSPSAPAPDAGYVGLYTVQVANGQSTVTAANITLLPTAPFLAVKLPGLQVLGTRPLSNTTGGISLVRAYAGDPNGNLAGNAVAGSSPPDFAVDTLNAALYFCTGTGTAGTAVWTRSAPATIGRAPLSGNRTYYVRTDGSDSNTGLSNTAGGAFLTIQKAINVAYALDFNGYTVTVQVGDGTRTNIIRFNGPFYGNGKFVLLGNVTTPANCVINVSGNDVIVGSAGTRFDIGGFKLNCSGGSLLTSTNNGSEITIVSPMDLASAGNWCLGAYAGGDVVVKANLTFSGSAQYALNASSGRLFMLDNTANTVIATPNYSVAFAAASSNASVVVPTATFSGSATGPRYATNLSGSINVLGRGGNVFPGSTAGTTTAADQYA